VQNKENVMSAYVVVGRAIPEGNTVYTLTIEPGYWMPLRVITIDQDADSSWCLCCLAFALSLSVALSVA
jgi:hypothetical protein